MLNYINYNYKINQIKLFANYAVEAGLTESNYSKTDKSLCTLFLKKFLESLKKVVQSLQFLIVSGRLLNSFDALSWKVPFLVGTTNLIIELLERSSLGYSCFVILR